MNYFEIQIMINNYIDYIYIYIYTHELFGNTTNDYE